jgi:endonuclease/exonuclease/phosphatase (EEP) superfamily protein YafD
MDYVESLEGPVVILGDFNDSPGRDQREAGYGLPDSLGILDRRYLRAYGDEATHRGGLNLDHIYVRDGRIGRRNVMAADWDISDHRPVWAAVVF